MLRLVQTVGWFFFSICCGCSFTLIFVRWGLVAVVVHLIVQQRNTNRHQLVLFIFVVSLKQIGNGLSQPSTQSVARLACIFFLFSRLHQVLQFYFFCTRVAVGVLWIRQHSTIQLDKSDGWKMNSANLIICSFKQ